MSAPLTLIEIRARWNDVLDHLESHDRVAWIAYFDARLADFDGQVLSLDFRDARKFAGGHEYSPTREKLESALKSSISEVLSIEVKIFEL
ncbi:MAG: hypothetical protein F2571_01730 [Actinobacteria bacterium]|jgi:hypothetical protein|uniref:Unannotated protein n=1 Tax=freshwater metagenome TaxID=449393 RepID=A0A6J6FBP3_9ZZZZ|nr:hypothetical protein [Actinomycetota bacterium]